MDKITAGSAVKINYLLKNINDELLDSSQNQGPLEYIQGKQNIVSGLEKKLQGKMVGDSFLATIEPIDAYGLRDESLVRSFDKKEFGPNVDQVKVGMQFQLDQGEGQGMVFSVMEVRENDILMDGNHPLAGETLKFEVEVIEIRETTQEEKELGFIKPKSTCSTGCC